MNTTKKGDDFEDKAYVKLKALLENGELLVNPTFSSIHKKKKYYSSERKRNIIFDLAIECFYPNDLVNPGFYLLIECKDYKRSVTVGRIEEFHNKTRQVANGKSKGIFVTSSVLQEAAFNYAVSNGIGVMRILPNDNIERLANYSIVTHFDPNKSKLSVVVNSLINPKFFSTNSIEFGLIDNKPFYSLLDLVGYIMKNKM